MMTPHIAKAIQVLFPDAVVGTDCLLQDDGDGPYIKEWNLPDKMPTEEQINQAAATLEGAN